MRVTIIADDKTVIVNGASVAPAIFPPLDTNVHAIQFFPETGHATIEEKAGEREHVSGEAALALVKPFVEEHALESARLKAASDATAAARAATEQATKDRHDRIRAELGAADQKAAEAMRAADTERQRQAAAAPLAQTGNMISLGTQTI